MNNISRLMVAASALALAGCVTEGSKPSLQEPSFQAWTTKTGTQVSEVRLDWWRDLGDPGLNGLVDMALARNAELGIASANLQAAQALAGEAAALRAPIGSVEAAAARTRVAAGSQPAGFAPEKFPTQDLALAGAALSWELDLFGGVEAAVSAAKSDRDSALWTRRGVESAVAGAVVRAWIDYRSSSALEATAAKRLTALEDVLTRLKRGMELGGVARADFETERAQLELFRAELPLLEAQRRNAARRLAVLTGEVPKTDVDGVNTTESLRLPEELRVDEPASVLRRRPDVAIAEAGVAGAAARAGVARADLYPRITLLGSAQRVGDPEGLDAAGALGFSFGPRLSWGILDFQRITARVRAADARAEAAALEWERTVLAALEEADGALDGWSQARLSTASVRLARDATVLAVEDVNRQMEVGAASPLALARAQSNRLVAEAALHSAEQRELHAWTFANLALGAGWRDAGLKGSAQTEGSAE